MANWMQKGAFAAGSAMLLALTASCTNEATSASPALPPPPIAQPGTDGEPYRGLGTEPFWSIEITPDALVYTPVEGDAVRTAYTVTPTVNGWHYESARIRIDITNEACSDGMSDIIHRDTVKAQIDGMALGGCGGGQAELSLDGTRWQGIAPGGVSGWTGAEITFANGQMTGTVGCRELDRPYILGEEWIAFGRGSDRSGQCPAGVSAFERDFMPIFRTRATAHQGNEGELILGDGHNELRFFRSGSCDADCAPIVAVAPLEQAWQFTSINGSSIRAEERERYSLTFEDGRFAAQAGCNRMSGEYSIDGDRIAFGRAAMTRMACSGDAGAHEAAFVELMKDPVRFQTSPAGHLLISDGIYVFEAEVEAK